MLLENPTGVGKRLREREIPRSELGAARDIQCEKGSIKGYRCREKGKGGEEKRSEFSRVTSSSSYRPAGLVD